MIPRYSRDEMTSIWTDQSRLSIWLEIEVFALEKMVELGLATKQSLDTVKEKARFDGRRAFK